MLIIIIIEKYFNFLFIIINMHGFNSSCGSYDVYAIAEMAADLIKVSNI